MPRLIDADDLMDWSETVPLTDEGGIDINDFEEKLKSMPTIDAEPQWIPCSERLPKMKEIVLITNDKGHVRCGQYRGVGFFSKNDGRPHWNWKGNTLETVVAWMPLPEPYEVKE